MRMSLLAALILTGVCPCQAQSIAKQETNNPRPVAVCHPEQAQKLIAQQIDGASKLADPAVRVSVLTIIADRLWAYDEPGARALFQQADEIAAVENGSSNRKPQSTNISPGALDPRYTVIEALARHDKAWARRLIDIADQQYKSDPPASSSLTFQHQQHSMWQLQQLALSLVATDQDAAIDFIRDSFRLPMAGQLGLFLYQLASRDQQAADALYQEAFKVYRSGDITAILGLSAYPFGLNQFVGRPHDLLPRRHNIPPGFTPNPHLQQALLEALFERADGDLAALARQEPGLPTIIGPPQPIQVYVALQQLTLLIQRYQPAMAEKAASLRSALEKALPPNWLREARQIIQMMDRLKETDFDASLASAQRQIIPDLRDSDIAGALVGYSLAQPLDSLCTAAQLISDQALRRQMLDWLNFEGALKAASIGNPDEAARIAAQVGPLNLRAYLTYEIASQQLNQPRNKTRLAAVVDSVVGSVPDSGRDEAGIMSLLGAASLYARGEDSKAFLVTASAIESMNAVQLSDPALGSIGWKFGGRRYSAGWTQKLNGGLLEEAFRQLGEFDLARAVSMASKIADRRSRAMAMTAIALHCLQN
jgi:hypothetical protein